MPKISFAEAKKINQDIIAIANKVMPPEKKLFAFKELYLAKKEMLNVVNLATLIHRLGQTGGVTPFSIKEKYQSFCKDILTTFSCSEVLSEANTQHCANVLNACAKLNLRHPALNPVLDRFMEILPEANTQNCANVLNACAKLNLRHPALNPVLDRFMEILPEANTQHCANVLNACAKFNLTHPVLNPVLDRFMEILPEANTQACANVLNACAKFNLTHPVLNPILDRFMEILPEANTQACANVLNACAKFNLRHPALNPVLDRFMEILPEANTQDCANVLNTCAKFNLTHLTLNPVLNRFMEILPEANTQACANVLNACAKFNLRHPALDQVFNRFMEILPEANTQHCANVLNACAKLNLTHPALNRALDRFMEILPEANTQACANACSALIALNHINISVFDTIIEYYQKIQQDINHTVGILWALTVLSMTNHKLPPRLQPNFQTLLNKTLKTSDNISEEYCGAYFEILAALQYKLLPKIQLAPEINLAALLKKFALLAEKRYLPTDTSHFEKTWTSHISRYLATKNIQSQVRKGAFELDLLINHHFNIEIDGPYHYVFEKDHYQSRLTDQVRDKILTSMGIQVIRLPFYELDKALASEDVDAYLDKKLKAVKMALAQEPQEEAASVAPVLLMPSSSDEKHTISEKKTEEEWTLVTSHQRSIASAAATTIIPTDITIAATHQTQPSAITTTPEEQPLSRHKIKQRKKQAVKQAEALSKMGLLKETTSAHVEDEQAPKQQQRIYPRCVLL
jgi:very-short-patch-repair endonuclease